MNYCIANWEFNSLTIITSPFLMTSWSCLEPVQTCPTVPLMHNTTESMGTFIVYDYSFIMIIYIFRPCHAACMWKLLGVGCVSTSGGWCTSNFHVGPWTSSRPLNWSLFTVYLGGCVAFETTGNSNLTIYEKAHVRHFGVLTGPAQLKKYKCFLETTKSTQKYLSVKI